MKLLILRPEPGASETAARARVLGLEPILAPLFIIRTLPWTVPEGTSFDAVLLTSANAPRHAGEGLAPFLGLPCFAVGERTAAAAHDAGFADVRVGPADGAAALAMAETQGSRAIVHLAGRDHVALPGVTFVPVYEAEEGGRLPPDAEDALVLLHSSRAARRFAELAGAKRGAFRLAAISPSVAAAAGRGWRSLDVAGTARDAALLALAAKLCQKPAR